MQLAAVSALKPLREIERERTGQLIQELVEAHARGEVSELIFAYTDAEGHSNYAVSGNTTIKNLAWLVACLQWRLQRWMDR